MNGLYRLQNERSFPYAPDDQGPARCSSRSAFVLCRLSEVSPEDLYVSKPMWWLESRFHFSFAEYCHPKKRDFGALFVLNDDLVQPREGFGSVRILSVRSLGHSSCICRRAHPHRNAEIFTYVLEGELSHADSMGNKEALSRGSVQYLSAGNGIVHEV